MFRSLIARAARTSRRTRTIVVVTVASLSIVTWAFATGHVMMVAGLAVMGAGLTVVTMRAVRAGRVRRAKIAAAVGRTRWPRLLATTLRLEEEVKYETRMHPVVMFCDKWVAISAAVFVLALPATFFVGVGALLAAAGALVGFVVAVVPGAIRWWFTRRCFTDQRVIVVTGILNKQINGVELRRIETVSHAAPFISSVLEYVGLPGVWHWRFDTQVQKDPFNDLPWSIQPSPTGDILEMYVVAPAG